MFNDISPPLSIPRPTDHRRLRTPLSARRAAAVAAAPNGQRRRDDEEEEEEEEEESYEEEGEGGKKQVLRARGASPSELERLRKAPLRHFDTSCLAKDKDKVGRVGGWGGGGADVCVCM